jgi:hypothetical protein
MTVLVFADPNPSFPLLLWWCHRGSSVDLSSRLPLMWPFTSIGSSEFFFSFVHFLLWTHQIHDFVLPKFYKHTSLSKKALSLEHCKSQIYISNSTWKFSFEYTTRNSNSVHLKLNSSSFHLNTLLITSSLSSHMVLVTRILGLELSFSSLTYSQCLCLSFLILF